MECNTNIELNNHYRYVWTRKLNGNIKFYTTTRKTKFYFDKNLNTYEVGSNGNR